MMISLNTFRTLVVLLIATAWFVGCSSVQFGYGQSERLMKWYVGNYVDFDGPQNRVLTQELSELKSWHCSTQLRGYGAWFREIRQDMVSGLTVPQIRGRTEQIQGFIQAIANDLAPRASKIIHSMSDAQVIALKQNLVKENAKYRARWVDVGVERYREERADRMISRLKWWVGTLTQTQKEKVRAWSNVAEVNNLAAFESRQRWQQALLDVVANRANVRQLESDVRALMIAPDSYWTETMREKLATNRELTYELLSTLAEDMTAAQHVHVGRRLESLAEDFDKLSCSEQRVAVQP